MSTPTTLTLPDGVEVARVDTPRGSFAAHVIRPEAPRGHVLLVPGWTGSKEDFTPILPLLAENGFAVTAYDQRGQFETPGTPDDDYSLAGFGTDTLAIAGAVADQPVHLLGHSFGGLVAQRAALLDPSAWASVSLLCTGPGALGESAVRPLAQLMAALERVSLAQVHAMRESMAGVVRPPEIAEFLERRFTANSSVSLRTITGHLLDAPDSIDDLAATGLPVWVGRGTRDDAWPHDVQAHMADRLGTTIEIIDAAHSPAVENPDGLVEAWLPFLLHH